MKLRVKVPHKIAPKPLPKPPPKPSAKVKTLQRSRRYRTIQRKFFCALCRSRYTRRQSVYDHFPSCVQKNGNPGNLRWDADVSCWVRARSLRCDEKPSEGSEKWGGEGSVEMEVEEEEVMGGENDEEMDEKGNEMLSSPPRRLLPASVFQRIAEWRPETAGVVVALVVDEDGEKRLHPFTVMRIASLVILASKEHGSRGVKETKAVFALWADLDPDVTRPAIEPDQEMVHTASARRTAIGVFANQVLSSCLTEADGRHDGLLALTSGLRDVAADLGAADTVAKIHDHVSLALGDEGPLLL